MDMIARVVRHVMPDSLFEAPPSDRDAEREGQEAQRASRQAIHKANRTVEDWQAALEWEREFWARHRREQRGHD